MGAMGRHRALREAVRQVAAPVDVTGHGPLTAAHWPTSSTAVLLGLPRTRHAPITMLTVQRLQDSIRASTMIVLLTVLVVMFC